MDTLLLNADYKPKAVLSWQKAIEMVLRDVVFTVVEYEEWEVHSPSVTLVVPAVLALQKYVHRRKAVSFSRTNIYIRDDFTCQYCGLSAGDGGLNVRDLTFDHVVPRSRGGGTTWENITTSCSDCNRRKGDQTPKEARMALLSKPHEPRHLNNVEYSLIGKSVPEEWHAYLPDGQYALTG